MILPILEGMFRAKGNDVLVHYDGDFRAGQCASSRGRSLRHRRTATRERAQWHGLDIFCVTRNVCGTAILVPRPVLFKEL